MLENESKKRDEFDCDKCGSTRFVLFYAGVAWLLCPECKVGTFLGSDRLFITESEAARVAIVKAMRGFTLIHPRDGSEMMPPTLDTVEGPPEEIEAIRAELASLEASLRATEKSYTIKCTKQEGRNGLAEYFRATACFLRKKADWYSVDMQVAKSAEALERVAAYCLTLADDNHLLARLFAMPQYFKDGGLFIPRCCVDVSRFAGITECCGLYGDIHPATWLSVWIDAVESDYPPWVKDMNGNFELDRVEEVIE